MMNPLVKDAMRRAGEEVPADGMVPIGDGTTTIACAAAPPQDMRAFFRSMDGDKYQAIRRNYLEANDKLIGLEWALEGIPELKAQLAIVKKVYADLGKTGFSKYM